MRTMTNRQRLLAVLHGRELDRVPFVQYEHCAAPDGEIWSVLGRNQMGILRWTAAHRLESPHCRFVSEDIARDGRRGRRTTLHAPKGTLVEETLFEPTYGAGSIKKHYVAERADYEVFRSYLQDVTVVPDFERLEADDREMGDDGLPHVSVPRSPYQQLWIQWVALEDLCVHLVEWPDLMAGVIAEMTRIMRDVFAVVARSPVLPYVVFPDNITAPTIGEAYFARYCVPLYDELGGMLESRNVPVFVHMDGDLKPLWNAIGASRVEGFDSLSPPPDNDTSAGDVVRMWPSRRVFLNFPSSVHVADPAVVYETARSILEQAGHSGRLEIQVSENVPPGAWKRSFPQIVRAVEDFGRP
jgi:hypothetical protein